jgi:hypothetical protein
LRDYVSHQVTYPIQKFICYEKVSPEYRVYLSNIISQTEQVSFDEANLDPLWRKAMKEELYALKKNDT